MVEHNREDLEFLDKRLQEEEKGKPEAERSDMGLLEKLEFVLNNRFERITYTEAIDILLQSPAYKKKKFKYDVSWGIDMQSEHERYLVEKHFKRPVIVSNYPKEIKAFYMRQNDDGKTVAAMDILAPGIGEIVGGSQREERLDKLWWRVWRICIYPSRRCPGTWIRGGLERYRMPDSDLDSNGWYSSLQAWGISAMSYPFPAHPTTVNFKHAPRMNIPSVDLASIRFTRGTPAIKLHSSGNWVTLLKKWDS